MQIFEKQIIKKLTDSEHLLLRPDMYIGGVTKNIKTGYLLNDENKFKYQEYEVIEGLLKIINEIIDNSIDEATRTNFNFANEIKIEMTTTSIKISDNGRGIPVEKMEGHDSYAPVICFVESKSGANFVDDERKTIGKNGVGSFATNVFSKKFEAFTDDGIKSLKLNCSDNCSKIDFEILKTTGKKGTTVYFEPDFKRFELIQFESIYEKLIKQRIINLSICYPKITFWFNKEKTKIKTIEQYFEQYFDENFIIQSTENYIVAVSANEHDDFRQMSFVNGLDVLNGGSHIDYFMNTAITNLKDKIAKKHKNIKLGEVRNKLQIVMFLRNFPNPEFDSQTKQKLTNTQSKIKSFLNENFEDFSKKLYNESTILDPIIEIYKIKEEYEAKKQLKEHDKETEKKIRIDKFLAPTKLWKKLLIVEGQSACSGLVEVCGRGDLGYYSLKGVPLNVQELTFQKVMKNKEFSDIKAILGIKFSDEENNNNLKFEDIVIATDSDADGSHITGLLLAFFHKFTPDIIKAGKLKILKTPLVVGSKNGKVVNWFFDFTEYNNFIKTNTSKYDYSYKKGLGSWKASELKEIISKVGFENMLKTFVYDETSDNVINSWMGSENADLRKEYIFENEFNVDKI